jgi:hypothetical protein
MGYYSIVTGSIAIEPPLPLPTIKDSRFLPRLVDENQLEVKYLIDEAWIPARAVAIVPAWEEGEPHKAYYLEEQLALIAEEVLSAGSRLSGHLIRKGEVQGDVERYGLGQGHAANEIVSEKAVLRRPSGEEVEI